MGEALKQLADETVAQVCQYWEERTPGWSVNDAGQARVKKWLKRFSVDEVLAAMDTAADQYLDLDPNGVPSQESWGHAWDKIPGICRVTRLSKDDPDLKELYYIRGILRKRLAYFDNARGIELLKAAHSWEVTVEELGEMARSIRSWTKFREAIYEMIDRQREILGDDGSEGDKAV